MSDSLLQDGEDRIGLRTEGQAARLYNFRHHWRYLQPGRVGEMPVCHLNEGQTIIWRELLTPHDDLDIYLRGGLCPLVSWRRPLPHTLLPASHHTEVERLIKVGIVTTIPHGFNLKTVTI